MPLPMKSLREASAELGIPEPEIKTMLQLGKVRAVLKKGKPMFAPDELAKIKRLRKSLPESAVKEGAAEVAAAQASKPVTSPPRRVPPRAPRPIPRGEEY